MNNQSLATQTEKQPTVTTNGNGNSNSNGSTNGQRQTATRVQYVTPLAHVVETPEGFVLEAELPGVTKEGLEINVKESELTVTGRRATPAQMGEALYRESRGADYRRTFELDPSIDTAGITAKLEQGVLRLTLPKAESRKPRRIEISA